MAKIATIQLNAVLKEEPIYRVTVTKHPVERGAKITDHAHPDLAGVSVEAIVSDIDGGDPEAAHQFFKSKVGKPEPIEVELPRDIYPLMVIEEYAPLFDWQTGSALHFRMKLTEWKVVNTALAAVQKQRAQVKKGPAKQDPAKKAKPAEGSFIKQIGKDRVTNFVKDQINRIVQHPGAQSQ